MFECMLWWIVVNQEEKNNLFKTCKKISRVIWYSDKETNLIMGVNATALKSPNGLLKIVALVIY